MLRMGWFRRLTVIAGTERNGAPALRARSTIQTPKTQVPGLSPGLLVSCSVPGGYVSNHTLRQKCRAPDTQLEYQLMASSIDAIFILYYRTSMRGSGGRVN
jgi:hypothetical protein